MEANAPTSWYAKFPGSAVAVENGAGQLVFVDGVLCRVLGYEPAELVGQPWAVLLPVQARESDRLASRREVRLRRKDGSTVPALISACRLPIIGDSEQRRLSIFTLPKESQSSHARRDQEEQAAIPDHCLARVAHELNNSLTTVTLRSQLLSRMEPTSPRFAEYLAILQDQVRHLKRIVAELQVLSDVNPPQFEPTDVNALIERTLEIQQVQFQLADVQVITDLLPDLPRIQADPHRLEQVLVNLTNNAYQALTEAGTPRRFWISTRFVLGQNGWPPNIRMYFSNNGPAIPPDLLTRIFEPFFTTKKPGQGTGLGLTICARIVREHRGRIWAESETPNGAVFVVELPIDAPSLPRDTFPAELAEMV